VARIETRVAELQARLTRARQERARALVTLRLLLGLDRRASLQLTDSLQRLASAGGSAGSDGTPGGALAVGEPREGHPTRRRLDALKRATEARLSEKWRSYWPTLDVVGNVRYQYPKNYFEIEGGLFYMAGIRLTWNVFDGDLLRRQRAELRAKVRQVESLRQAADQDVRRKLADAAAKRRMAAASAAAARRTRRAAQVYLKAARVSRKAGTGTALEERKAEEALDKAQLAEVKAWFESALARAQQLRAQGVAAQRSGR
jgi:outer membrane protein TolC